MEKSDVEIGDRKFSGTSYVICEIFSKMFDTNKTMATSVPKSLRF